MLRRILTGLRLFLNFAFVVAIAVELVSAQKELGAMIWLAWQTFRTEELYISLVVTALLGIFFNLLLQCMTIYSIPWRTEQRILCCNDRPSWKKSGVTL